MILSDMIKHRVLHDIIKHVDSAAVVRRPNRAMALLREFGLANATIGHALGLTEGVVSCWATGSKPCPAERQAELDMLSRQICGLLVKASDIPPEGWAAFGNTYFKTLNYLDSEACLVTHEERAMLSNAAPLAGS
jgi:hypothetical protein